MRITDAKVVNNVGMLRIICECGRVIHHISSRWNVVCPCGNRDNMGHIRASYPLEEEKQDHDEFAVTVDNLKSILINS